MELKTGGTHNGKVLAVVLAVKQRTGSSPYLWSKVFWSSAEGLHCGLIGNALFAQPKVCYFDVSIFIQHEILQL